MHNSRLIKSLQNYAHFHEICPVIFRPGFGRFHQTKPDKYNTIDQKCSELCSFLSQWANLGTHLFRVLWRNVFRYFREFDLKKRVIWFGDPTDCFLDTTRRQKIVIYSVKIKFMCLIFIHFESVWVSKINLGTYLFRVSEEMCSEISENSILKRRVIWFGDPTDCFSDTTRRQKNCHLQRENQIHVSHLLIHFESDEWANLISEHIYSESLKKCVPRFQRIRF